MNTKLSVAGLVAGVLLLPVAGIAADQTKPSVTEKVKEDVGDAVITGKIKAEYAKDKQVSAMRIKVDTDSKGMVTLSGTAQSQAEADKAVSIAKSVQGVTDVRNDMQIAPATATRTTTTTTTTTKTQGHGSDQPLDDTGITTRVKARMATDKMVRAGDISVTTVNGVVELSGNVQTQAEAKHAVSIARTVPHVKSVKNNLQVAGAPAASTTVTGEAAKHSDQPIDDTMITTRVKARMTTDKTVDAGNISVKTTNGVVQLSGFAKSQAEADKAVSIARGVDNVKSVKSDIQVK